MESYFGGRIGGFFCIFLLEGGVSLYGMGMGMGIQEEREMVVLYVVMVMMVVDVRNVRNKNWLQ